MLLSLACKDYSSCAKALHQDQGKAVLGVGPEFLHKVLIKADAPLVATTPYPALLRLAASTLVSAEAAIDNVVSFAYPIFRQDWTYSPGVDHTLIKETDPAGHCGLYKLMMGSTYHSSVLKIA
jgi:hypothetical protein